MVGEVGEKATGAARFGAKIGGKALENSIRATASVVEVAARFIADRLGEENADVIELRPEQRGE